MSSAKNVIKEEILASYLKLLFQKSIDENARGWARSLISRAEAEGLLTGRSIKLTLITELAGASAAFVDSVIFEKQTLENLQEEINALVDKTI